MISSNPVFRNIEKTRVQDRAYVATYTGITIKTAILVFVAFAATIFANRLIILEDYVALGAILGASGGVAFISVFVSMLIPRVAMPFGILYAAAEGFLLGTLTLIVDMAFPGQNIGITAVLATGAIFGTMLGVYSLKILRATPAFRKGIFAALIAILIVSLVGLIIPSVGMFINYNIYIAGALILFGAFMLILDFERAKEVTEAGMPKNYEWVAAIGLMVTIFWIYFQILKLLVLLASKKEWYNKISSLKIFKGVFLRKSEYMDSLNELKKDLIKELSEANDFEKIEKIKNKYLSKKGILSEKMSLVRNLSADERPLFGKIINEIKEFAELEIFKKINEIKDLELIKKMDLEKIDISLPPEYIAQGTIHPLSYIIEKIEDFFLGQGFLVKEGPEVESDYYNFEMMNFDKDHPARQMQDTFYIDEEYLLRTHTSPVQARAMQDANGKPLKIICPGKTYRRDEDDPTHSHQFMQCEGLVIDSNISFANLKDTLLKMIIHLFGDDKEIRIRPSYFPFVEPGVEVDVVYNKADGTKGYIEVLGAGMVHPNVLKMGGYDPDKFSGFAFGIGIERIAILKYEIEDIRNFYNNDLRFLKQFKGDLSWKLMKTF